MGYSENTLLSIAGSKQIDSQTQRSLHRTQQEHHICCSSLVEGCTIHCTYWKEADVTAWSSHALAWEQLCKCLFKLSLTGTILGIKLGAEQNFFTQFCTCQYASTKFFKDYSFKSPHIYKLKESLILLQALLVQVPFPGTLSFNILLLLAPYLSSPRQGFITISSTAYGLHPKSSSRSAVAMINSDVDHMYIIIFLEDSALHQKIVYCIFGPLPGETGQDSLCRLNVNKLVTLAWH